MCLIAWNWQPGSATPLLLLANRDEFYARPTLPLHWWEPASDGTQILAGKDLQGGGTWLGVNRNGRMAALTNYRQSGANSNNAPSRGELVTAFLHSDMDAASHLQQLAPHAHHYNPFNLLVCDGRQLMGLESRHGKVLAMPQGFGAVSNADFQTPWPKLTQLLAALRAQPEQAAQDLKNLLPLLHDNRMATDDALPHTGIPLALERVLSAAFIATAGLRHPGMQCAGPAPGPCGIPGTNCRAMGPHQRKRSSRIFSFKATHPAHCQLLYATVCTTGLEARPLPTI